MEQWKIKKDQEGCAKSGCPLPEAQEYYAVLQWPDCLRRDLCGPCFRELETEEGEPPFHWKVRRKADGKTAAVLDLVSLRRLFDTLGEVDEDGAEPEDAQKRERASGLRYLVALLLLRKRVLKMVDAVTAEQEAAEIVVIDPKVEGMEPVALSGPDLDGGKLEELKQELLAAVEE